MGITIRMERERERARNRHNSKKSNALKNRKYWIENNKRTNHSDRRTTKKAYKWTNGETKIIMLHPQTIKRSCGGIHRNSDINLGFFICVLCCVFNQVH